MRATGLAAVTSSASEKAYEGRAPSAEASMGSGAGAEDEHPATASAISTGSPAPGQPL